MSLLRRRARRSAADRTRRARRPIPGRHCPGPASSGCRGLHRRAVPSTGCDRADVRVDPTHGARSPARRFTDPEQIRQDQLGLPATARPANVFRLTTEEMERRIEALPAVAAAQVAAIAARSPRGRASPSGEPMLVVARPPRVVAGGCRGRRSRPPPTGHADELAMARPASPAGHRRPARRPRNAARPARELNPLDTSRSRRLLGGLTPAARLDEPRRPR